ncbi:unnamed protein product, partial [Didymodactylos carnosus]
MQHLYTIHQSVKDLAGLKDYIMKQQIGNKQGLPDDYPVVNRNKQVEVKEFVAAGPDVGKTTKMMKKARGDRVYWVEEMGVLKMQENPALDKKLVLYTYAQEANLFVETYLQHYQTTGKLYYPIKLCVADLNKSAYISRGRVLKYMNSINGLIIVGKQDETKKEKEEEEEEEEDDDDDDNKENDEEADEEEEEEEEKTRKSEKEEKKRNIAKKLAKVK